MTHLTCPVKSFCHLLQNIMFYLACLFRQDTCYGGMRTHDCHELHKLHCGVSRELPGLEA